MKNGHVRSVRFFQFLAVAALVFLAIPSIASAGGTLEKGLVILVSFPDVNNQVDRNRVQTRFDEQLNDYVKQMSYGKVSLNVDVTKKWLKMPRPVTQYKISSRNLEVDKSRVRLLIDDALDLVDKEVDFSKYSFTVIFMNAQMKEYGMIGLCGYPGMLGWNAKDSLKTKSGQVVKGGVAIFCFQAHLGTLFHDIAHVIGGVKGDKRAVPCLYDHDLQAKPGPMRETFVDAIVNMGFWDPMSCHYYERDLPPPGLSSWTKLRLNWMDQSKVRIVKPGKRDEFVLGPLEDGSGEILAVKIPISNTKYYLIENRQPIGFDKTLPGSGVLIMYADDDIPECRHGKAPVKLMDANPSVPNLKGAAYDVGGNDTFEDRKHKVGIQLKEKIQGSYKLAISPL